MAFSFLNQTHVVEGQPWQAPDASRLWRYNLHYFDDFNAFEAQGREPWHVQALTKWIADNAVGKGDGWEAYPTSLRIVNWIKWALRKGAIPGEFLDSLAAQSRYLSRRLEYHLLGNHLLANAKALVFAGLFFKGDEAESWLESGLRVLAAELPEQILPDGGHFERSTMYHALALEDLLDLMNISFAFAAALPGKWTEFTDSWPEIASRMQRWLDVMTHPDGDIALFNDAAIGIAPSPREIARYAADLGVERIGQSIPESYVHLAHSGYIRASIGGATLFLDVAPVGPEYLPGHAHADTLSFELSLFGRRVVVNGGTSEYGPGPERQRQRGTAAHSTVTIDGVDSSEVWSSFRVARRAMPCDLSTRATATAVSVACSHDGYLRLSGRPVHRRRWWLRAGVLEVEDTVDREGGSKVARFHLAPWVRCTQVDESFGRLEIGDRSISWSIAGGKASIQPSLYCPEFGKRLSTSCILVDFSGDTSTLLRLAW